MATSLIVDAEVNGSPFGPWTGTAIYPDADQVWFGAFLSGPSNDFKIRNIAVGTSGFGSSDLYAPALASTADFDSVVNPGTGLTAAGGILAVVNGGLDTYGVKGIGAHSEFWVQFDLNLAAAMLTQTSADYHDIALAGGQIVGVYSASSQLNFDGALANAFDGPLSAATWMTLGFHYRFVSPAAITLAPTAGPAGTVVSVSGTGFAPLSALTAAFDGSPVALTGTTVTDGSGAFSGALFAVPAVADNIYPVVVTDASSDSAFASFTVAAVPTVNIHKRVGFQQ